MGGQVGLRSLLCFEDARCFDQWIFEHVTISNGIMANQCRIPHFKYAKHNSKQKCCVAYKNSQFCSSIFSAWGPCGADAVWGITLVVAEPAPC